MPEYFFKDDFGISVLNYKNRQIVVLVENNPNMVRGYTVLGYLDGKSESQREVPSTFDEGKTDTVNYTHYQVTPIPLKTQRHCRAFLRGCNSHKRRWDNFRPGSKIRFLEASA